MAEFILGRIKFVYRNNWVTDTVYVVDDVITQGGRTYICINNHTSSELFATDYSTNPELSEWNLLADGQQWRGDWTATEYYNVGDLAKYGGIVYQCKTPHIAATYVSPTWLGLENDQSKWDEFATSMDWKAAWTANTRYKVYDLVTYGGQVYICKTKHISAATDALGLEADQGLWDSFNQGITYLGDWTDEVRYRINDVVRYGADLWICTTYHTADTSFDNTKFSILLNGFQFENSWSDVEVYQIGDVVTYGGYSYIAKTNHTNEVPSTSTANWAVYTTGFNFRSDWNTSIDYLVGDVVRLGGYTYVALVDNVATKPPSSEWNRLNSGLNWTANNETYTAVVSTTLTGIGSGATFDVARLGTSYSVEVNNDGSSFVTDDTIKILGTNIGGLSPANDIIITVTDASAGNILSISHTGNSVSWKDGIVYVLGDIVFFGPSSYICVQGHTASSLNRPDADNTATYWNILAAGAETATLTTPGDTLYYGPNGPQRLPIGRDGQVLRVSDGYPVWATYGHIFNSVFVGPTGVDEPYPAAGFSIDKPWKTVRFACKQVEEGYRNPQSKRLLETNKQFLIKEVNNYISYTYKASITGTSSGTFLTSNTSKINVNMPITFGTLTGSLTLTGSPISTSTVYYIKAIVANTSFTVSATPGGAIVNAAGTGTGIISFNYDSSKAERDAGYIIDGLIYDLTHGGTQKTTANTFAFYDVTGTAYITDTTGYQITQFIGSHDYLKIIVADVLSNATPDLNYQSLNGVSTIAYQIVDETFTAEADANANVQSLLDILINGLSAGNISTTAAAINPNTTVNIKTGTYTEVLPIVVPANTAVVGDELRSTVVQPKSSNPLLVNDKKKTISALTRIKNIIPDLIANNNITETAGNTATQITSLPAGSLGTSGAAASVTTSAQIIYDIVNTGFSAVPSFQFNVPTGYNTSFLAGYGDGKAQIVQNYEFIKADVLQYYANSLTYGSLWTGTDTLGREKGKRDIGLILDALQHDMTYGGNVQSLVAGSSYYSSYLLNISAAEKPAFIDAFTFMKSLLDKIVQKTAITAQSGNTVTRVTTGNAGSPGASTFAQARIQDVIDWINTGEAPTAIEPDITWASASLQTSYAAIQAKRTEISLDATAWVQKYYQNVVLDLSLTTRDAGLLVDAIAYDLVLGTNFNSLAAGRRYLSNTTSTNTLRSGNEKAPTLGAINFIKYKVKNIATAGAVAQMQTTLDDVINSIAGGKTPKISYPDPVLPNAVYSAVTGTNLTALGNSAAFNITRTAISLVASPSTAGTGYSVGETIKILGSNIGGVSPANDIVLVISAISGGGVSRVTVSQFKDAVIQLEDNRNFLLDEVIAYIDYTYPALEYDKVLTRRDSNYILDALHYDLTYGGDSASQQAGQAYYSFGISEISSYVKTATLDAISRLSTVAQLVVTNSVATATTGNTTSQVFKNGAQVAGPSIAATTISALVTKIYNYVDLGLENGAPSITITDIATTDTFTSNAHGLVNGDFVEMRNASTNGLTLGTTYYVVSASTNTFKLAATYGAVALTIFTNGTGLTISVHKTSMPYLGWVDSNLTQVYSTLSSAKASLQTDVVTFINTNYANLDYDESQARSDSSKVIDAVAYDFMFNSNFRAVKAGQAYNRPQAAPLKGRLQSSTRESLKFLQTEIQTTVSSSATAALRVRRGMEVILAQLTFGVGETPEMNGTTEYNNDVLTIAGVEILRANIDYLTHESTAWVDANFGGTVTQTSATGNIFSLVSHSFDVGDPIKFTFNPIVTVATATTLSTKKITLDTTAGVVIGMPVTFDGTLFGGVSASPTVYYVASVAGSDITISTTNGGLAGVITSDASGIMEVTIGGVMGGINANTTYYVLSTPTIDTFTVTAERDS